MRAFRSGDLSEVEALRLDKHIGDFEVGDRSQRKINLIICPECSTCDDLI